MPDADDLERHTGPDDFACDICVGGGGAVGLVAAVHLARAGRRVVLLEGGGVGLETRSQSLQCGSSKGHPFTNIDKGRYRVLGGSTIFWGGQVVPFNSIVFGDRRWVSDARWPFGREQLEPYYRQAYRTPGPGGAEHRDGSVWQRIGIEAELGHDLELLLTRWVPTRNFSRLYRSEIDDSELLHVVVHANVTGFITDDRGRVTAVEAMSLTGRRAEVSAGVVILACGTIEIARLLLQPSRNGYVRRAPDRLWAISGHALAVSRIALPLALRYLLAHRSYKPTDAKVQLAFTTKQIPHTESTIRVGREKDELGLPRVEVDWRIDGRELKTFAQFARRIKKVLEDRKLARVTLDRDLDNEDPSFLFGVDDSIHQMSTARIGRTAQDGVDDENLRVHGTENMYVAGAAVFPVAGFANPTFTAITLGFADLLLLAALAENATGVVLFSTRRPEHIKRAALVADDSRLVTRGAKFHELVSRAVTGRPDAPARAGTVLEGVH